MRSRSLELLPNFFDPEVWQKKAASGQPGTKTSLPLFWVPFFGLLLDRSLLPAISSSVPPNGSVPANLAGSRFGDCLDQVPCVGGCLGLIADFIETFLGEKTRPLVRTWRLLQGVARCVAFFGVVREQIRGLPDVFLTGISPFKASRKEIQSLTISRRHPFSKILFSLAHFAHRKKATTALEPPSRRSQLRLVGILICIVSCCLGLGCGLFAMAIAWIYYRCPSCTDPPDVRGYQPGWSR